MTKRQRALPRRDDFDWEQPRAKRLFAFLEEHKQWNKDFQAREFTHCLAGCANERERLIRFLHWNVNTQSSPDMDALCQFWQTLHGATAKETASLEAFTNFLARNVKGSAATQADASPKNQLPGKWEALFTCLRAQPGWGVKTTALLVKGVIQLHRGPAPLHFWPDATPSTAPLEGNKPYLPVDQVILRIFKELGHPCPREDNINKALRERYSAEEMLIWDDLWFWGFFTQRGGGLDRELGWNPGKFWNQLSAPKEKEAELQLLAERFLGLLK